MGTAQDAGEWKSGAPSKPTQRVADDFETPEASRYAAGATPHSYLVSSGPRELTSFGVAEGASGQDQSWKAGAAPVALEWSHLAATSRVRSP